MAVALQAEKSQNTKLVAAEAALEQQRKELRRLVTEAAVDVGGLVDPTPTMDLIGGALALSRGDYVSAGLSLLSCIPYAGDILAKPVKGSRLAKAIETAAKRLRGQQAAVAKLEAVSRNAAAKRVREARDAARQAKLAKHRKPCPYKNPFGTRVPNTGKWVSQRGNGLWYPGKNTRNLAKIKAITKKQPIRFVDGYPDFSPYATHTVKIRMTGDDRLDFAAANAAAKLPNTPKGFTWHHNQDGETMMLIPSDLHNNVPHTGGASVVADKRY